VDDQINRLLESDKFSRAAYVLELIARSLISLQLYSDTGQDIDTIVKKNYEWVQPYMTYIKENHFPASWMHIGADKRYLSKYYCYLWSEILATDLFSAIKSTGLLNQATGQRLIERILSKGAACDPNQLLRDFLGCEPNEQAFFKKLNA
jgi:thimet oligopeptidase